MIKLLRAGLMALGLLAPGAAFAQSQWITPTPGEKAAGAVQMCLNSSGQAVPVSGGSCANGAQVATQGYKCAVSTTRPNDTNAYTANDVIGSSTSASGAVWSFSSCGPSAGGEIMLTSAELEIDASAIISGETNYNLYLYNVTVPSALGDNAAFDIPSGDRASFLGKVSLGTPVDEGSTLYVRTDTINAQFTAPSGGALFGYLVTVGGYTPTAQRVYKVTLHFVGM